MSYSEAKANVPSYTSRQGRAPVAIVMISLNEAHNMEEVLDNIQDWAQEVFAVDSYSTDTTVDIALRRGVHVVQRRFRGFGDQWNFALGKLPITSPWTMKLDPDERLTTELKESIEEAIRKDNADGFTLDRRLFFMGRPLPIRQTILRVWRTGKCKFSEVLVNEHPMVQGRIHHLRGEMEHHDSPNLHHWIDKQNRYSTAEALSTYRGTALSASPRLLGSPLERRMWLKRLLMRMPLRSLAVFLHCYLIQGAFRAGKVGMIWASLRASVYRMRALKLYEMRLNGREIVLAPPSVGKPHPGAMQADT